MTCLAIVLHGPKTRNGRKVFDSFKFANQQCFWNRDLVTAADALVYMGFMRPGTLFVSAPSAQLQALKTAWARRVLKPADGYQLASLGDLGEIQPVEQMHFVPLGDVVCDVIAQLNRLGQATTLSAIRNHVTQNCPQVAPPSLEMMRQTINSLSATGIVYRMGELYFVSVPTVTQPSSSPKEKHTVECQTGMSIIEPEKKTTTRKGIIARLFSKRQQNQAVLPVPPHPIAFSTEFPPPQWMEKTRENRDRSVPVAANIVHNKFPTYHDRLCDQAARVSVDERERRQRRRRGEKMFSSSSECLNYGPIDPPECLPGNVEVIDEIKSRRRRRDKNQRRVPVVRTSTPVGSDSAYSPSPVTDSNEEKSWSEPEEIRTDHTYMNVQMCHNDSTRFEDISSFVPSVEAPRLPESNV